jgi:type IV pilus assembly protein PilV
MMRRQQGMTLIEVMIAMIILGVGILGVSGMQVISLQQNRSALFRGEATQLANDLMDRLRVNTDINYSALIDAVPTTATNCVNNSCNPVGMAAFDISQWKCSINSVDAARVTFTACGNYGYGDDPGELKGSLPLGAGSVALVSGVYEVTVQWSDDRVDVPCGIRDGTVDEPTCTTIVLRSQVN